MAHPAELYNLNIFMHIVLSLFQFHSPLSGCRSIVDDTGRLLPIYICQQLPVQPLPCSPWFILSCCYASFSCASLFSLTHISTLPCKIRLANAPAYLQTFPNHLSVLLHTIFNELSASAILQLTFVNMFQEMLQRRAFLYVWNYM